MKNGGRIHALIYNTGGGGEGISEENGSVYQRHSSKQGKEERIQRSSLKDIMKMRTAAITIDTYQKDLRSMP